MKTEIKCYRCGRAHQLNYKTIKKVMTCDHCHGKMTLDFFSQKKLKNVVIFVVGVVAFFLLFAMQNFKGIEDVWGFAFFVLAIGLAITFSLIADKVCLFIAANVFKLEYVELEKMQEVMKNAKKKKGEK